MLKIGVLSLQGGVREHLELLAKIPDVKPLAVKKRSELAGLDGLILPGGESTTMAKLIDIFDLKETIIELGKAGMPIWGTCAGMILLAQELAGEQISNLGLMEINVRRNAYGNQLDSFKSLEFIPKISEKKIPLVFIRAPFVTVVGEGVEVLLELEGKIVAVEENNLLATSFHPELTGDLTMHRYFVSRVLNWVRKKEGVKFNIG